MVSLPTTHSTCHPFHMVSLSYGIPSNHPLNVPSLRTLLDIPYWTSSAPLLHIPGTRGPSRSNPRFHNPRFHNPRFHNPRFHNPTFHNPRIRNHRFHNPRSRNPRFHNPRTRNPQFHNPRFHNPRIRNPRFHSPRSQTLLRVGPSRSQVAGSASRPVARSR